MAIKVIIFDMGGVLTKSIFKPYLVELNKRWGVTVEQFRDARRPFWDAYAKGLISEKDFWTGILDKLGVKEDYTRFSEGVYSSFVSVPETIALAKRLKKGYRLAILSNNSKEWGPFCVKKFGLDEIFDDIILSCDVKVKKPSPEIFLIALKRLKVKPEECIFIDDKDRNIAAAASLGIKTVKFEEAKQLEKDLACLGMIFDVFEDFCR
jgi:putative hydrolase of the HAD superfamily